MRERTRNRLEALEKRHARDWTPYPQVLNFGHLEDEAAVTGVRIGEQTWPRLDGESLEELEKRALSSRSDWPPVIIVEHILTDATKGE